MFTFIELNIKGIARTHARARARARTHTHTHTHTHMHLKDSNLLIKLEMGYVRKIQRRRSSSAEET